MINTFSKNIHSAGVSNARLAFVCALLLLVSACGKDSSDGDERNTVQLPTDTRLDLYCADIGLFNETCVLDDPNNPYARTPFAVDDPDAEDGFNAAKFKLAEEAPSPKALFYVWATALARAPTGENQYYTARALHQLYTASESETIRAQAVRAYRSALDNFFDSATFFPAGFLGLPPDETPAFPLMINSLTAQQLALPTDLPLFDPDSLSNNEFFAREAMGSWGFTWVGLIDGGAAGLISGPVFEN